MDNYSKELSVEIEYLNETILQITRQLTDEVHRNEEGKNEIISS